MSYEVPVNIKVTNQSVVHHMSENNHRKKKRDKNRECERQEDRGVKASLIFSLPSFPMNTLAQKCQMITLL